MGIWLVVAGAFAGLVLGLVGAGPALFGIVAGGTIGWLIAQQRALAARLEAIEARLPAPAAAAQEVTITFEPTAGPPPHSPSEDTGPSEETSGAETPPEATTPPSEALPAILVAPPASATPTPPGPDPIAAIKRWFSEGNVPVKVGMLVLFAGVGALLKYATDEGWLHFPIELRLAAIAAAALAGLAFGFREREKRRTFALSLQGGSIGILVLTIFAAFRLYELLPATLAFALLIVIVTGTGLLAVLQNAGSLAVLGSVAGFLAPILVSTGSGNHVVLFTWYALLNAGIFGIAWAKAWRALNVLGFVCTFGVATTWGVLRYEPADFWTTEPFLLLFFAFYLAIPVLYGSRQMSRGQALVDGTLVFGTPVVAMGLQAVLLEGELIPLALSALAVAVVELVVARTIWRRPGMRVVGESYAALAIAFATLSVPLALSARTTAGVFAVEGAALIWLGLRQDRKLARYAGLALQALASVAFIVGFLDGHETNLPILNGTFAGLMLLVIGASMGALAYWRMRQAAIPAGALFLLAAFWWVVAGVLEIEDFVAIDLQPDALIAFAALSAWIFAELHRRLHARLVQQSGAATPSPIAGHAHSREEPSSRWLRPPGCALPAWSTAATLVVTTPLLLFQLTERGQPLSGYGALAWLAFALFGTRTLLCLRDAKRGALALAHLAWLWAWVLVFGCSLYDLAHQLGTGWRQALFALPLLIALALVLRRPAWIGAPIAARFATYPQVVSGTMAAALALAFLIGLFLPGDAAPLPFVPLANPLDLAGIAALVLITATLSTFTRHRLVVLAGGTFALLTAATLRAVHHLTDFPWRDTILIDATAQASLSVVWSILGVAAWVAGSRRQDRALWLTGAVLMGLVLAKLGLIDRQHLGNLTGIVSFLAYGVLCTVVGYVAPAPPRAQTPTLQA